MPEIPEPGPARDRMVAEVLGLTVPGECVAIYVEGEWSLHPDSDPAGWACHAGVYPVYVAHCMCGDGVFQHENPDGEEVWDRINAQSRAEWEQDHDRWGHSRHCLAVVPRYSTSPADALAALEAWRAEHPWRFWEIGSPLVGDPDCRTWNVVLYQSVESDEGAWSGEGPTLPAAATAALLATGEGE